MNKILLFHSIKNMSSEQVSNSEVIVKKQKIIHPEYVKSLHKYLNMLVNALMRKELDISQYINNILRVLPDFFTDVYLKNVLQNYLRLFEYSCLIKSKAFLIIFCTYVFTKGLCSFFTGFDGFYGEDISAKMYSNKYLMKIGNYIKDNIKNPIKINISQYRTLMYYLEIKLIAEQFVSRKQRFIDNQIYKESFKIPITIKDTPIFVSNLKIVIP